MDPGRLLKAVQIHDRFVKRMPRPIQRNTSMESGFGSQRDNLEQDIVSVEFLKSRNLHAIARSIGNCLVITRQPSGIGRPSRHKVKKVMAEFEKMISSNRETFGGRVFVVSGQRTFRETSNLDWRVLLRFTDESGGTSELLQWSGEIQERTN